jgi:CheY-like chemotaxis protein
MKSLPTQRPITIVIADDDPEDRLLARQALDESQRASDVHFVEDGVELLSYLRREGRYDRPTIAPQPSLIVVDLNMPRMDGREAIAAIKGDPRLRHIPIVVLTTSRLDEDILTSYSVGASSYITKPASFDGLVDVMRGFLNYWTDIAELPRLT